MEAFQQACEARDIQKIMALYPTVLESPFLSREDTRRLARALHTHIRSRDQALIARLLPFVQHITTDIKKGKLPPHPAAHIHILGMFKEAKLYEEGYWFWQWLAEQDDTFVSQAVYGAAIELLAYRGKHTLPALEDLYQDALKRFPGTFAEYHLAPEAVVPDRSRPITIPGIPIALLQGILTARILNRDWKNAYLALDTALRLYPTSVPHRFFELFMTERPVSEAYTVFTLACRAGVVFKPSHLTRLLALELQQKAMRQVWSLSERTALLRGMANAIYAYLESGGTLEAPHVGSFFGSFQALLPPMPPNEESAADKEEIRNSIVTSVHQMMALLIQSGFPPHPQLFTALVGVAAKLQVRELLDLALKDLETSGVDLGDVGRRVVLNSVGQFNDRGLVEKLWNQIVTAAETSGGQITRVDWLMFAKACRKAGCSDLFDQQLQGLKHAIDSSTEAAALEELQSESRPPYTRPFELMNPEEFAAELKEIEKIMGNVAAVVMAGQPLDLQKTPFSMFLDVHKKPIGAQEDLRAVYDELTTDPHQPEPPKEEGVPPALSPTGIPLDELRFQNWVTIHELMADAEASEAAFQKRLDEAIATGRPLDKVRFPIAIRSSHTTTPDDEGPSSRLQLRQLVKQLRAPYATPPPPLPVAQKPTVPKMDTQQTVPTLRYHVALEPHHVAPGPPSETLSYRPKIAQPLALNLDE
jgi:hypothetical protein